MLDKNDVLFRLHGVPICVGSLVVYQADNDTVERQDELVCMVLGFVYEPDLEMHVVEVLLDGQVTQMLRSDLRPFGV